MRRFADAHRFLAVRELLRYGAGCALVLGGLLSAPTRGVAQSPPLAESRETAVVRAAEQISPSIVTVNILRTEQVCDPFFAQFGYCNGPVTRGVPSLGSGFVVDPAGIILTNEHVVRGADRILVTFADGRDAEATLIGADAATDVAVLKIEGGGLTPVAIGR
jgi:serine protease Do